MRILFGVQTTGHGHLVRSTPVISQLRGLGHEVSVVLSGPRPNPEWIQRIGRPLEYRPGLTFSADGGRIRYLKTARQARPLAFLRDVLRSPARDPDLVLTDYEPITAWYARRRGIRSVGFGHLYAFAWPEVPRARGNLLNQTILDWFAPVAMPVGFHWSDFGAPIMPPPVDPEIRNLKRNAIQDDLILVYLAFTPLPRLLVVLHQFPRIRFHVYAKVSEEQQVGNVSIRPISRREFLVDMAQCAGVIANAGFTLTSECLHLGIRVLVQPIHGQLEQESNAVALKKLGLGRVTLDLGSDDLFQWLGRPPPLPQRYPDVTAAIVKWLHAGANEPLKILSRRLWHENSTIDARESTSDT